MVVSLLFVCLPEFPFSFSLPCVNEALWSFLFVCKVICNGRTVREENLVKIAS